MGHVNWLAVLLAAALAVAMAMVWHGPIFRTGKSLLPSDPRPTGGFLQILCIMLIGSAMLGHFFARIGPATLDAKPWLYFMQSAGIAIAFVLPAVWLSFRRAGQDPYRRVVECGYWLVAYLAMGTVFWILG